MSARRGFTERLARYFDRAHARAPLPWLLPHRAREPGSRLRWRALELQRPGWGAGRRLAHGAAWAATVGIVAAACVARLGGRARPTARTGRLRQFLACLRAALRDNVDPVAFYRYGLYRPGGADRARDQVLPNELGTLLQALNAGTPSGGVDDKERLGEALAAANLPGARVLARIDGGRVVGLDPAVPLPARDLVLKPVDRWGGSGVRCLARDAASGGWSVDGDVLGDAALRAALPSLAPQGRWLLQVRLVNHAAIRPLAGSGVATVRIVTHRGPAGVEVLMGALRMPQGASFVDNFAAGGIVAPLDLATGRAGPGTVKGTPRATIPVHPGTGARIEGFVVPLWTAACDLACRAHGALSPIAFLGWDVVIGDEGPAILEANTVWCGDVWQLSQDAPLGRTRFPELYEAAWERRTAAAGSPKAG